MNDLERRFLHHPPSSPGVGSTHAFLRQVYLAAANVINQLPESRERSLAMTELEQSSFWAHAAVARGQVTLPSVADALKAKAAAAAAIAAAKPAPPEPPAEPIHDPAPSAEPSSSPVTG